MRPGPTIVWFRHDLRTADQPALERAIARGGPVIPVFIHAPDEDSDWPPGAASLWWLHRSLASLDDELRRLQSRLILRRGPTLESLRQLARAAGATGICWCRRYEPAAIARDAKIETAFVADGLDVESFNGSLLWEPWKIQTIGNTPFKVFTPFWRRCAAESEPAAPAPAPPRIPAPEAWPQSLALADLALEPRVGWDAGLRDAWRPGADGASAALDRFVPDHVAAYKSERDRPDHIGTSRLSPFLHFGEISPRLVWHKVVRGMRERDGRKTAASSEAFLRQLVWREFATNLLYHFPQTPNAPLREEFAAFPWDDDPSSVRAWQRGQTGYPYIDAGMRELWHIGWMHNRVRMAVASFLVKDLLISWQSGARWFWDTLVDADLANNTLGWQWVAGSGADAAPFFRIFNPVSQGKKFDPQGDYVRRWVPELARLRSEWIHQPWAAPRVELESAGVELGATYPHPIVDHAAARKNALAALAQIRTPASGRR